MTQALDETLPDIKSTTEIVQRSATNVQLNGNVAEEVRAAAKKATEVDKATLA